MDSELVIGDWSILRRDRDTLCGGVLLAARTPLALRRRREYETDSGEDLWASFTWQDSIVPPDAYHLPLEAEVSYESARCSNIMDPSNINPARDWNFNKCNHEQLYSLLSETSWDSVLLATNVPEAISAFYQIIYDIFNNCMPKKHRSKSVTKRYSVWFTPEITKDIKRKVTLHGIWKRSKHHDDYKNFSDLRNSLKHRVATAYQIYTKRVENKIRINPREFWRQISRLRSKGGFEPSVSYCGDSYTGAAAAEVFAKFLPACF
ncbi:hypothetical protein HF086_012779 [Spodoptera exigua]|uniref:Uncharacterized protein n=1 Tax=Spodoptera exigua TaxID=7107 RepID=A0A922MLW9_SPOEX|nr:hypothetical protein HF086_012779 [Spodoptera exigua]